MRRIAILGPESAGKTELAKKLAECFQSPWIPEFAREYIEKLGTTYTYEDVCNIANYQIDKELFYSKPENSKTDFIFFDTELIITKVWFEFKYKIVPDFLIQQLNDGFFDFYLLCAFDLEWQPDSVREHGDDREYFFDWYKTEIEQTGKPFVIVSGYGDQRFQNAINALKEYFDLKSDLGTQK